MPLSIEHIDQESPEAFLKKAVSVASYYGFTPMTTVATNAKAAAADAAAAAVTAGTPLKKTVPVAAIKLTADDRATDGLGGIIVNAFADYVKNASAGGKPGAAQFYHSNATIRGSELVFGLEIIGSTKPIAEAITIRTALTILEELGFENLSVHVNGIGDKESSARFARELGNFFRRRAHELPPAVAEALKTDVWTALETLYKKTDSALADETPRPVDSLSETSRAHLSEMLRYLESMDVPYAIDERILANRLCFNQTAFEIRGAHGRGRSRASSDDATTESASPVLAKGGRYDALAQRLFHVNVPGVGLVLSAKVNSSAKRAPAVEARERKPRFFFIQIGFDAKLASFSLLEKLRKARVHLAQSLSTDSLHDQLALAEKHRVPYAIIIGYKEALAGEAIVRNMVTRAQETVRASDLPEYLKKLPLAA